jgi:ketosteroid isomerase-like protein
MSQENVEVVRRWYDAFNRGDVDVWLGLLDPQVTWQAAREDPDAAAHQTRAGARRYAEQWVEAYEALHVEPRSFTESGDRVVVWVRVTGTGRMSGISLDMEQAQVMTVRDGSITFVHEYFDRAEALAAAGLSE